MEPPVDQPVFCDACLEAMPTFSWPVCPRCAARVPEFFDTDSDCGNCRPVKLWFDRTMAVGEYEGRLRDLLLRMKQEKSQVLAATFARLLADRLGESLMALKPDVIVPIPMHSWRRLVRRTNPAEAVAEALGRRLGLPTARALLKQRRNMRPQLGLTRPGRIRNVHGQFVVAAGYSLESAHVLLVDDIMTTGATCSEAARVLKHKGAGQVTALVVGRTSSS